jgi:hypothetical protein
MRVVFVPEAGAKLEGFPLVLWLIIGGGIILLGLFCLIKMWME